MYPFVIYDIRPSAVQSCRFVSPVEIDQKPIPGRHFRSSGVEVHDNLVISVHIIDLEALDPHLCIVPADILHIPVKCPITGPQNDADPFLLSVLDKSGHVYFGNYLKQIRFFPYGPAMVKNHIFNVVGCCEINVVFVGLSVYSCLEVHPIEIPPVPPVPCHFPGLDP